MGGEDGVWMFDAVADGVGFRIQNGQNGEFLFVGSRQHDDKRRYACTWVGGGSVEGDAGIWDLERVNPKTLLFRIRNRKYGETLYSGSSVLDPQRRFALTWVGGGRVEGMAGVWQFFFD